MSTNITHGPDELWWVYVLHCAGNRYYVGASSQVDARWRAHAAGTASAFTRAHPVEALIGTLPVGTRRQAMVLERRVKRWKPARKRAYFRPYRLAWDHHHAATLLTEAPMYAALAVSIDALNLLEAQHQDLQRKVLASLDGIAPDLLEVLRQTGCDDAGIGAWLCYPNTQLSGRRPVDLVAHGEAAVVMALIVRAQHGVG